MQISSTVIAAQQAAREARARFQAQHVPKAAGKDFAGSLEKAAGFSPLPLRQTADLSVARPAAQPAAQSAGPSRLGSRLDITV